MSGSVLPAGTWRLARALVLRERRSPALWVAALLLAAIAATGGWQAASRTAGVTADPLAGGNPLTRHFAIAAPGVFALVGALLVLRRISADHDDRWLAPLLGRGVARRAYPAALAAVLIPTVLCGFWFSVALFAATRAVSGGGGGGGETARMAIGGGALVLSAMAFALALGVRWPNMGAAVTAGAVAVAVPFGIALAFVLQGDALPPRLLHQAIFLHLPPLSSAAEPLILLRHLTYTLAVGFLALALAERRVARYP